MRTARCTALAALVQRIEVSIRGSQNNSLFSSNWSPDAEASAGGHAPVWRLISGVLVSVSGLLDGPGRGPGPTQNLNQVSALTNMTHRQPPGG